MVLAGALGLASGGCLLFTSVADLGGGDPGVADGDGAAIYAVNDASAADAADQSAPDAPPVVDFGAPEKIAQDTPGIFGMTIDAANVYWTNPTTGSVWRAAKASTDAGVIVQVNQPAAPTEIALLGGRLYVSTASAYAGMFSYAPDGSNVKAVQGCVNVSRVVVAASAIFGGLTGCSSSQNSVFRLPNGGAPTTVYFLGGAAAPSAVTFDGENVYYYSSSSAGTIQRVATAGNPSVFSIEAEVADLLADTTAVYALTTSGKLVAHPLPSGSPIDLATGLTGGQRVVMDDAAFYVATAGITAGMGRIVRVPRAGGATRDLATAQQTPHALAVDASGVYWVNADDGSVMRVAKH